MSSTVSQSTERAASAAWDTQKNTVSKNCYLSTGELTFPYIEIFIEELSLIFSSI